MSAFPLYAPLITLISLCQSRKGVKISDQAISIITLSAGVTAALFHFQFAFNEALTANPANQCSLPNTNAVGDVCVCVYV